MNYRIILPLLFMAAFYSATSTAEANKNCPAIDLLSNIDDTYHECRNGYQNNSCEDFVFTFSKLAPRYDCQRSFDTKPVPAIWLANTAAFSDYLKLLIRLTSENDKHLTKKYYGKAKYMAKHFFGSSKFRDILDGHHAEEYYNMSVKIENDINNVKK